MPIAITGSRGQLGQELCHRLGGRAVGLSRPEFDLTVHETMERSLYALQPEAIINCAAYTAVDQAEREAEVCTASNAKSIPVLVEICRSLDIPLIQLSTDYVFSGDHQRNTPYSENDRPNPQGVYGRSKLAGEHFATKWKKHFVIRTCGLYSASENGPVLGKNFVDTMLALAAKRDRLDVVADQICTPTYIADVSDAIQFLLSTEQYGTYHVTNRGQTSWFEFARKIFEMANRDIQVNPISTKEYGARASRPAFSVLDTSRYESVSGNKTLTWKQGLASYFKQFELLQPNQARNPASR